MIRTEAGSVPLVYLDPGHNAVMKPGNCGAEYNGMQEQAINWTIAQMVRGMFGKDPKSVLLTKKKPFQILTLKERAQIANKADADMLVSIHCNAHVDEETEKPIPGTQGIETFHFPGSKDGKLCAEQFQSKMIEATGANDRGIKEQDFKVLRKTKMVAVLVELGFLTSPVESSLLKTVAYQNVLAEALVQGIVESLKVLGKVPTLNKIKIIGER
jgi:N-acetylmuramoyl-L-alanine amidase